MNVLLLALFGCVAVASASYRTFPAAQPNPYCKHRGDFLLHPTDRCKYLRCEFLPVGDTGDYYQGGRGYGGYNGYNGGYGQGYNGGYGQGYAGGYGGRGYGRGNAYGYGYGNAGGYGGYAGGYAGYGGYGNNRGYGKLYAVEQSCAPGTSVPEASYPAESKDDYARYGCPFRISTADANSVCTEHVAEGDSCPIKSPFNWAVGK